MTQLATRKDRSFVRDVAVNVLANLIAASIIYLAGVASGAFPRNPRLVVGSVVTLAFLGLWLLTLWARVRKSRFLNWVTSGVIVVVGVAVGIASELRIPGFDYANSFPWWAKVLTGLGALALGGISFAMMVRDARR